MRIYVLEQFDNKRFYIPEKHWKLIRERHAKGLYPLSILYDLTREQLAAILTSHESDLVSR